MKGPYWISEYVYIYSQYGLEKIGFPKFDDIILVAKRDSREIFCQSVLMGLQFPSRLKR
jgi:hypothetical protein